MKRTTSIILLLVMTFSCFSQNDWFGFKRYKADNERIIKNGEFPEVVFMGNSITENWAYFHPDFFKSCFVSNPDNAYHQIFILVF